MESSEVSHGKTNQVGHGVTKAHYQVYKVQQCVRYVNQY